jgi:hypothetical protein
MFKRILTRQVLGKTLEIPISPTGSWRFAHSISFPASLSELSEKSAQTSCILCAGLYSLSAHCATVPSGLESGRQWQTTSFVLGSHSGAWASPAVRPVPSFASDSEVRRRCVGVTPSAGLRPRPSMGAVAHQHRSCLG